MSSINFSKLKKDLLKIYEEFLKNPSEESLQKKIREYHIKYAGLTTYNEILKSRPVPKDIEKALNGLSTIYQYGMHNDDHPAFSNEKIIQSAKKILEEIKG